MIYGYESSTDDCGPDDLCDTISAVIICHAYIAYLLVFDTETVSRIGSEMYSDLTHEVNIGLKFTLVGTPPPKINT